MLFEAKPRIAERRRSRRFALPLALKLRAIESVLNVNQISSGECLNISSSGLLFATTEPLFQGQSVEASLDWPMLLDHRIRLILVVKGQIVRVGNGRAAMRIERYEFKTAGVEGWRSRPEVAVIGQVAPDRLPVSA